MDEFTAKRLALQDVLIRAALDLFEYIPAAGLRVTIPDTEPPVYIVLGDTETIVELLSLGPSQDSIHPLRLVSSDPDQPAS
jgi:hypothetical protein